MISKTFCASESRSYPYKGGMSKAREKNKKRERERETEVRREREIEIERWITKLRACEITSQQ